MGIKAFNHGDDFRNKFVKAISGDSTGLDAVNPKPPPPTGGITATGGVVNDYTSGSNAYRAHTFTTSGAFEVTSIGAFGNNIEFLVVAGGGGGGGSRDNYAGQGGGGAGGLITNVPGVATPGPSPNPNVPLTRSSVFDVSAGGTYPVTVGAGGIGGFYPGVLGAKNGVGGNGTDSVLTHTSSPKTITATGGGGAAGATNASSNSSPGGSGGGGSTYYNKTAETQVQIATLIDKDTLVVLASMVLDLKTLVAVAVALAVLEKAGVEPGGSAGAKGGQGVSVSINGTATVYAGGGGSGFYFNPNTTSWSPSAPVNGGGGGSGGTGGGPAKPLTRGNPGTPGTGGGGGGATASNPGLLTKTRW